MNDVFSTLTGLMMHAYEIATFMVLISIPGRMILRALHARSPI